MDLGNTANRYGFVENPGGKWRNGPPPPIYRMARCKKCPKHCKPCLTVDEALVILEDETRAAYKGNDLCAECHKKSNAAQNKQTFAKAGRDFADFALTEEELLEKELAALNAELEKLQAQLNKTKKGK